MNNIRRKKKIFFAILFSFTTTAVESQNDRFLHMKSRGNVLNTRKKLEDVSK